VELCRRGILLDRDEDGHLLQIFTKPIGDRPAVFFGFHRALRLPRLRQGQLPGAVRALEREQERRGNF
jgi:4-hydroxyphenylpyruvate dioxygenase